MRFGLYYQKKINSRFVALQYIVIDCIVRNLFYDNVNYTGHDFQTVV